MLAESAEHNMQFFNFGSDKTEDMQHIQNSLKGKGYGGKMLGTADHFGVWVLGEYYEERHKIPLEIILVMQARRRLILMQNPNEWNKDISKLKLAQVESALPTLTRLPDTRELVEKYRSNYPKPAFDLYAQL